VKVYTFIDREKARTEAEREAGEVGE